MPHSLHINHGGMKPIHLSITSTSGTILSLSNCSKEEYNTCWISFNFNFNDNSDYLQGFHVCRHAEWGQCHHKSPGEQICKSYSKKSEKSGKSSTFNFLNILDWQCLNQRMYCMWTRGGVERGRRVKTPQWSIGVKLGSSDARPL